MTKSRFNGFIKVFLTFHPFGLSSTNFHGGSGNRRDWKEETFFVDNRSRCLQMLWPLRHSKWTQFNCTRGHHVRAYFTLLHFSFQSMLNSKIYTYNFTIFPTISKFMFEYFTSAYHLYFEQFYSRSL